jgi:hypothetical protein
MFRVKVTEVENLGRVRSLSRGRLVEFRNGTTFSSPSQAQRAISQWLQKQASQPNAAVEVVLADSISRESVAEMPLSPQKAEAKQKKRLTLAAVNKALAAAGAQERLANIDIGQWGFVGGQTEYWRETFVGATRLSDHTLEGWISEWRRLSKQSHG